MTEKISYKSLETISKVLLVLCVVFFTISIFLVVHFFSQRTETESLQAQLLSQVELQTQLLESQASDHSLYPHLDRDIGYVLNPYMKSSTWRADESGEGYRINTIGLRGKEITKKAKGVTRILLLGDSVIFGWKLRDEDRIASVMNTYLADRLPSENIEIVTIALPGWNVISEMAFVENHLDVLQPDFIIWNLHQNDVEDVSGVVPPGILARWNSSQKSAQTSFSAPASHIYLPMPILKDRWDNNISSIQSVQTKYGIPVVILWFFAPHRSFLELLLNRNQSQLSTVIVPGQFRFSNRSWCLTETDCHPSPWATNIIALGLLDKLVRLDWIEQIDFSTSEQQIIQAFQAEEKRIISAKEVQTILQDQLSKVPNKFVAGDKLGKQSVLYGLNVNNGKISKNGVIFLRDTGESSFVNLDFETPHNSRHYSRSAIFTVRNQEGETSQIAVKITTQRMAIRVPLPNAAAESVYELIWQFDYTNCHGPFSCSSGKLHSAKFQE